MRIKFSKEDQRKFFDLVIEKTSSPSLRGLIQFGIQIPYSTLKNYYSCSRLMPESLFKDLLEISNINEFNLDFERVSENWGKSKGGKISKRGKT